MSQFLETLRSILDTKLFDIGATTVTVSTLITVGVVLLATFIVSRAIRKLLWRVLSKSKAGSNAAGTITGLVHYVILIFGFGIALQTVGIDLSALFAAGALFAVAIGFAMQSITQNFVAGFILLSERAIKTGDILEVEGKLVKVLDLGVRSTTVETREGEHLIVPNAVLIGSTVKNFTLKHTEVRIRVSVGVVYSSDMALVRRTLERVAGELNAQWGASDRNPMIQMTEFGNHAVNFDVGVWLDTPWEIPSRRSDLHEAIWWAFHEQEIVIAFPQLDVHFDAPVAAGLARINEQVA